MTNFIFNKTIPQPSPLREAIDSVYRCNETEAVISILEAAKLPEASVKHIRQEAEKLVEQIRKFRREKGGIDAFMSEYDLSTAEGIALMCLAEAMLRVPDTATIDRLIRDKILSVNWQARERSSDSLFVNTATWGLMLSGRVLGRKEDTASYLNQSLQKLLSRLGEPIIRRAVKHAMKILGKQFVMGETIQQAIDNTKERKRDGFRFSYDMLGEAARTAADAERYYEAYEEAIKVIGANSEGKGVIESDGISVKLSALHPRYEVAQREYCLSLLIEKLHQLSLLAKDHNIGLTVDAEEADRLDISLDIIEEVITHPDLKGWDGFGLAIQTYQKRCLPLIDWLEDLAKRSGHRLMVRLVKGAYWDYEIKDSQVKGLKSYPVYTRKMSTDVNYIACIKRMLAAGERFFPQFATHNAYSFAVVRELLEGRQDYEFQCLKGMGGPLYNKLVKEGEINCRVYAPVGEHRDLLPYLVRRLLENGANTSFVNRIVDDNSPIEDLIADPVAKLSNLPEKPHPHIPLPVSIFEPERKNSEGVDLSDMCELKQLATELQKASEQKWQAGPIIGGEKKVDGAKDVVNPSDKNQIIGKTAGASPEQAEKALEIAAKGAEKWSRVSLEERANILMKIADLFESQRIELMALAIVEGGKTIPDAVAEVREAADFCRYYAGQGRRELRPRKLPSPTGETNELQLHGRGVIACISPWNFPLAIFTGQVVAAIMSGNAVVAKPAAATTLIAAKAVELMLEAGVPKDVVQLLPGKGSVVGAKMVEDERVKGVMFTGSTETARWINQALSKREGEIIPFIAETGGQNALIADSTALPEQLVQDILTSSFYSAGQRCSALRVLFIQEEIADRTIEMLAGAMAELKIGDPKLLATDVGPVINEDAKTTLLAHQQQLDKIGKKVYQAQLPSGTEHGTFFAPCAYEIESLRLLEREVFGPILHIVRYKSKSLDKVIASINETKYGLTLGVHSRIKEVSDYITERVKVGNLYVNRNIIGAVVGVQPFGGEGLSGTGPKAGGPYYLPRLSTERVLTVNTTAAGGNTTLMTLQD